MTPSRRAVLGALVTAATLPYASLRDPAPAAAATATDRYPSNTALYADPALVEGRDYGRRYRRHGLLDDDDGARFGFPKTTVVAPHGGGIEFGTSELCLAIAGYHPGTLAVTPPDGPTLDYWMFEGLRSSGNAELHVTATHCDDTVARSLCAASLNAVVLHGCSTETAGLPAGTAAVLVGGRNAAFRARLLHEYDRADVYAVDAVDHPDLSGTHVDNIVNRTLLGMGAQLELTAPLRTAMFSETGRERRPFSTTETFRCFVAATRTAIASIEADQVIL